MIVLHTGQPGAGKTLYTLWHVEQRAKKEGRTVYFFGITDCKVPGWIELDSGDKWHTMPAGSIVVIDEAQRVFRPRSPGSQVPAHVEALETHRHAGIDLYVITQHPKLLDTNIRRLVGLHRHVMRAFGAGAAIVHEWNETRPDPDLSREGSISTTWRYPKEVFAWYKSAEVHTHKARVPLRVWLVLGSPLLLVALGYGVYAMVKARVMPEEATPVQAQAQGVNASAAGSSSSGKLSPAAYVAQHQPRIAGLAYTAPAFDEVTEPTRAPFPAACVSMRGECRCYTQQATRLDMPADLCESIVARGFFKAWDERERSEAPGPARQPIGQPEPATQAGGASAAVGYPGRYLGTGGTAPAPR